MKYIVAILVFMAALLGLIVYIGDASQLFMTSTSPRSALNFEVQFSWRIIVVAVTVGLILLFVLWSFLGWLARLPGRLRSGVGSRRRTQALEAMEDALIAGAKGDVDLSRKKSEKARSLIQSPALGHMVSAQAAEACGDNSEAIAQYSAMLEDEKTIPTARRGLAQLFLATGDLPAAILQAREAYQSDKNAAWAFETLFQAQVADYRWGEALETLAMGERRKHISKPVARRRRSVLQAAQADALYSADKRDAAREMAVGAANETPEFAPAVALAAHSLYEDGQVKKAAQLIERAWAVAPHPALSIAYLDLFREESDKVRTRKIQSLVKTNPDHRETKLMLAEEALRNKDGVEAWSILAPLTEQDEISERVCQLAAASETLLNNPQDARIWLERAAVAPSEPSWTDLDPKGSAFEYSDQDWRRLVFSFGENGTLIHPRFESGAARRPAFVTVGELAQNFVVQDDATSDDISDDDTDDVDTTDTPSDVDEADDAEGVAVELTPKAEPDGPVTVELVRQPDDPGDHDVSDAKDLADRLDSLLETPSKPSKS